MCIRSLYTNLRSPCECEQIIHSTQSSVFFLVFIAHRVIPMIAFHGGESIYLYVCGHLREYALYTLLRKLHHSGGGLWWGAQSINGRGA